MSHSIEEARFGDTIFTTSDLRSGITPERRNERSLRFGRVMGSGSRRGFRGRSSFAHPVVLGHGPWVLGHITLVE